jgi:excisionase family DNA binding protein
MSETNEFLTAIQAAQMLGVSDATVRNRIADGSICAKKHGREWRIALAEVERVRQLMADEDDAFPPKSPNETNATNEASETTERNLDGFRWEVEILRVKLEAAERENRLLHSESENLRQQGLEHSQSIRALTEQIDHPDPSGQALTQLLAMKEQNCTALTEQMKLLEDSRQKPSFWRRLLGK